MVTVSTQVRIDEATKKTSCGTFGGLRPEVMEAMEEAKKISHDPNTKRYGSFSEALGDLDI